LTEVYDTWRKSLLKALVSNQPWSFSGGADGKKDRIAILSAVLDASSLAASYYQYCLADISDRQAGLGSLGEEI
jgi:hypothetical protein